VELTQQQKPPLEPKCGERHPRQPWFRCTEDKGHTGDHVAGGTEKPGTPAITWPQWTEEGGPQ